MLGGSVVGALGKVLDDMATARNLLGGELPDSEVEGLEVKDNDGKLVEGLEAKRKVLAIRALDVAGGNLLGIIRMATIASVLGNILGLGKPGKDGPQVIDLGELPLPPAEGDNEAA